MNTGELVGHSFSCLEGCGFCCTFQPEVSTRELALLRKRTRVDIASDGERSYLTLQNKCGACTLLDRMQCTQYDLRPAHCRYFPFHVHFSPEPEVFVNYTCRGVERTRTGDLTSAFQSSVLGTARPGEVEAHAKGARETYGEFQRLARRAGVWGDVAALARDALADGFPRGDREHAMAPFGNPDVTKRPFYLAPDLRWLTFERDGEDALTLLLMDEKGALLPQGRVAPEEGSSAALMPYLERLTLRGSFAGSVYDLVDESDYETTMEEATRERLAELGEDLALRASILRAMVQVTAIPAQHDIADEVARFYDTTFLDASTIGGWL